MNKARPHEIHRQRTAIGRAQFSRPVRLALESGLLNLERTLFDFGCGRGQDLHRLDRLGVVAKGWDPAHRPHAAKASADVVNLGYVVNVIEDPRERHEALAEAWSLARRVLVVAARLDIENRQLRGDEYADGCVTSRDTFQKLFSQQELREWVTEITGSLAIPAAPGVVFVFRDEGLRQSYLAARYQRRRAAPRIRKSDRVFDEHRATLQPLIDFLSARGRLPARHELENADELEREIGTIRQAHALLRRVMGSDAWESVRTERAAELLIYLALEKIPGRAKFSELADELQRDIKEFFSSYKAACEQADNLLYESGDPGSRDQAMRESTVGKLTGNALYVHVDALPELPTILRVYEGCAHQYVGDIEGANVVKLNRQKPQVSYLMYPEFRKEPHPPTRGSLIVRLGNPQIRFRDYSQSDNPGILHRKEELLAQGDPDRDKFARLTRQEENWGLYEAPEKIGTLRGWNEELSRKGLRLRGHRVVRA